ncbi:septal ring lytic transglycosylase RlpA family protein [Nocardiopsis sp. CT-R113]|uniref:Probable endolytic peptidoglycan transglycosylase RlpA n=1 Tax=Nocardiopsis codii TaxID=3065942 RepID=A0ABU7K3R1_9ACTN|nr:septal ring lytic transglycosylase RlpA family protein [Nocardiopsis sp. CT-R113]MEE2036873.1 septal ring lytic transglycosylase RlpA family protein [Nocardiopsis sp. CT-R113]
MGKHEPQTPPVEDDRTDAPAVGPRVAAKRSRRKRTMILASATGLTLLVGGTATAAVIASGADPGTATNAAGVPDADPDPLVADDATPQAGQDALQQAENAVAAATQSTSSDASDVLEEPEEEEDEEPESAPDTGGGQTGGGDGGTCQASFYGAELAGSSTANGESFDPSAMTAAHKSLPFDTQVQVTNPSNGKSVTVRINDRGPYIDGRCLDLSTAAFDQIIGTGAGVGQVEWQVVG